MRAVPRCFPVFRGLTSEMLCDRQFSEIRFGGFGVGELEPPFVVPAAASPPVGQQKVIVFVVFIK